MESTLNNKTRNKFEQHKALLLIATLPFILGFLFWLVLPSGYQSSKNDCAKENISISYSWNPLQPTLKQGIQIIQP